MNNIYKDNALKYLEKGMIVIPLNNTKPAISNWKKYTKKTPTKKQIEKWVTKFPDANLGLLCGEASGITVVECCSSDFSQIIKDMPTPSTASNGEKSFLFFNYNGEESCRIGKVKIHSDGDICIIPPSVVYREDYVCKK